MELVMGTTIKNMLRSFRRKMNGDEVIETKTKMRVLVIIVMAVHLLYMQLFTMCSVFPLVMYNLVILSLYILLLLAVKSEQVVLVYSLTFVELVFNAVLSTVMIGWNSGFFLCIICVVPISFYLAFSALKSKLRILLPLFLTVFAYVLYVLLYQHMKRNAPLILIDEADFPVLFMANTFVVFFLMAVVSFNFIIEMQDSTNALMTQNEDLGHEANVDPLTGLLNRRGMEVHLQETMNRAKVKGTLFSVIIGDIDNFKRINDTYSHECGDRALIHVADIMKNAIRQGDAVCRWGGEEFLILVQGNGEIARMIGERIRQTIENHSFMYKEDEIKFTMTFGASAYVPGFAMATIIKQADDKLYEGKTSGKNKVVL
ncbi:MAG: GGDEF domain-containing protein [Clostridium sp.]|nr:GGDEF domain-containing protein [Clostridium sp.]